MISLSVKPEDGEANLLGKTVNELQSDISISDNVISGTLHYVTGYTGFNGSVVDEQSGNYLALKIDTDAENAETTVELVGGTKGPVTLDEDMNIVLLIKDKDTQSVKVTVSKDEDVVSETYTLTGLTLEEADSIEDM